jgi:small neutral amino acid transporter SnatA (MarC family)
VDGRDKHGHDAVGGPDEQGQGWAAETIDFNTYKRPGMLDYLKTAFVTMLVTLDPPRLAPALIGLTLGMARASQREVALRATIIAYAILAAFAALAVQFVITGVLTVGK